MLEVNLQFAGAGSRTFFHRGTKTDTEVIDRIFRKECYTITRLGRADELTKAYRSILAAGQKPLIVDAGANIGAASVVFAVQYPEAHVVAFEPERQNFELLTRNTQGLDVEAINAAVGCSDGKASVVDPGIGETGYRALPDPTGTCDMISMSRTVAIKTANGMVPFLLKVNIEGGEANLFQEPTDWVNEFPIIIIELHDWLLPKQRTAQPFLRCIARYDREIVPIFANLFSIRNT